MAQPPDRISAGTARIMILPGSTIGIIGGGQLGRMSALAAFQLGYKVHIFSPGADDPAKQVTSISTTANYSDEAALRKFAEAVDVVTFEFENIPADAVRMIAKITPTHPSADVLHITQHRRREKDFLRSIGVEVAPFAPVHDEDDLRHAVAAVGFPCILKTSEQGYDGKGQGTLREPDDRSTVWGALAKGAKEFVLEGFVDFELEMSVIVARNGRESLCYQPVHNIHKNHILHKTIVPAPIGAEKSSEAVAIAARIADGIGLKGIMAVEMFLARDGRILVNELAPRPHNSGHWSLDAAATSQFEQHIRAVCGLPLGDVSPLCSAEMLNLIGDDVDDIEKYLGNPQAKLHLYGKTEARAGRKMGHVTFLGLGS